MNSFSHWRSQTLVALICCIVAPVLFAPQFANAQKVANYDYTDAKFAERLRPPLPDPPPVPGELHGGVCGGVYANSSLIVSILSLDRDSYAFGDEFKFVLRLEALLPTRVPVGASIAEAEPSDPEMSYEWRHMGVFLELRTPNYHPVELGLLSLYGSKEVPGSEVELKKGEWIELRGKARMEWPSPSNADKWDLQLPLRDSQEFSAMALARRGEGHHFDAATRRETRVCHPAEQSATRPVHLTVAPEATH